MSRSRRHRALPQAEPAVPPAPLGRRVAAFDLGARRIGVAVTDATGAFVAWRGVIRRHDDARDRAAIAAVLDAHVRATIVVGLPLRMDQTEGEQARRTRQWTARLFADRPESVLFRDERLTSQAAQAAGAPPASDDAQAAEVLLLDYLSQPQHGATPDPQPFLPESERRAEGQSEAPDRADERP